MKIILLRIPPEYLELMHVWFLGKRKTAEPLTAARLGNRIGFLCGNGSNIALFAINY